MADVTTTTTVKNSGPNLPHLLKWIKHRASKKENRYATKKGQEQDEQYIDNEGNINVHLYNKTSVISRSSDNIHRIKTDLSLSDKAKLSAYCTDFSPTSLQTSKLRSESMVALSTHLDTEITGDVICKHGSVQRTCRSCMQLPPLPPGHERILRDLQRLEKKKRQEQKSLQQQNNDTPLASTRKSHPVQGTPLSSNLRVQTPFETCGSPEHIYEEIPGSFFGRTALAHSQQLPRYRHDSQSDGYLKAYRSQSQYRPNQSDSTKTHPSQTQISNHQKYPPEHHQPETTNMRSQQHRPSSRQVSLGNLDFELAKECDGFLVVPLRDKKGDSPPMNQLWQHSQQNDTTKHAQQSQVPQISSANNHENQSVLLPNQSPSSSRRIAHSATDSGYQEHSPRGGSTKQTDAVKSSANVNTHDKSHLGEQKCCGNDEPQTQGYNHCRRCKRPHGLYHGVSLCHSDVEDLRQELQYLDIAGLDKHKLRGTTAESSPSLLHNVAHRRSAFSKYIPKRKLSERSSTYSSSGRLPINRDSTAEKDITVLNTDSYKRQSMSAESDYFSSNYNTSQSDTTSRGSRANYVTTSEKSNDTFSEYDIQQDACCLNSPETTTEESSYEYEYYLAKARHNNMLKNNVKRILRSSESERSDADCALFQEDTISLTSVTSLSELSTLPADETHLMDKLSCRVHRSVRPHSSRSSHKHNSSTKDFHPSHTETKTPSPIEGGGEVFKSQTRTRKPIRKKRKPHKMEYYKLPNFSGGNSPSSTRQQSDTASISDTLSTSSGKRDIASIQDFDSCLPPQEHFLGSPSSEKLSCRVTDFQLCDMRKTGVAMSTSSKGGAPEPRTQPSMTTEVEHTRSSVYSNHGQINRNSNNRLLSDLMRMNHDRQLFSLI